MIVTRRPDGVVQIRRRPAWRAALATVPGAVLGWLLLFLAAVTGLATVLVLSPTLASIGGLVAMLALVVWRSVARQHAQVAAPAPPAPALTRPSESRWPMGAA